jgi:hypothetical protein
MRSAGKIALCLVGAGALLSGVFSDAMASTPRPMVDTGAAATFNKNVNINGILHVKKNLTVYGNQYTHGKYEVYNGLTVRAGGLKVGSGGITTDVLSVGGQLNAASASISGNLATGNLQAQNISGSSLTVSGATTLGGALTTSGKITANGVDAGTSGLTTSGSVTAGSVNAGTVSATGAVTSGSVATSGLRVTGTVDFTGATLTGFNVPGGNLPSLTVGNPAATTAPLSISENSKTATIGVDTAGALVTGPLQAASLSTTGNVTVGGNLTINGTSSNLTVSSLTAPNTANTTTPGAFTVTGNPINLQGNVNVTGTTTLSAGSDLVLTSAAANGSTPGSASHINAGSDKDVAGQVAISVPANATAGHDVTSSVTFVQPYSSAPIVVITPVGDPETNSLTAPKYWVTTASTTSNNTTVFTGFTVHYAPAVDATGAYGVTFNYHVIGGSTS